MPNLQRQGVPIPDHLQHQRTTVRERSPMSGEMGGTRDVTRTYSAAPAPRATRQTTSVSRPRTTNRRVRNTAVGPSSINPVSMADKSTSGVGLLEGEFLLALGLLIMLMFANSTDAYLTKVMSLMKRGTLVCILFFLLALIASIGPNAAKFSKAFGALVIVAILITTPINTVLKDTDNLIKNDWVATNESANDQTTKPTADTGTGSSQSGAIGFLAEAGHDAQSVIDDTNPIIVGYNKLRGILHLPNIF